MTKTVYTIQDGSLQLRFDSKKQADNFYKNNKRDYMDAPERKILRTKADIMSFYENGYHPYREANNNDYIL